MNEKQSKNNLFRHIMKGLRNALIVTAIIILVLLVISIAYATLKGTSVGKTMYLACYYGSILILLVSVPQFYRRNESSKARKIRNIDPMFGFYGWFGNKYNDDIMEKSFDSFKGDGFWLGIMLVTIGTIMLLLGFILENIFFVA